MKLSSKTIQEIKKQKNAIHVVLIGTKPDIIKQAPLIKKLKRVGHYTLVVHSGQHTQFNLSGGLEQEFGIFPDVNLGIFGNLFEQQSQIILRFGSLIQELKEMKKQVIPYICADTTTALAAGIASFANQISTVHVEAGLRTMSPQKELVLGLLKKNADMYKYFNDLKKKTLWKMGSYEPYPEQFDTRAAGPSAGIHFAPTQLNFDNLVSEGYANERIFVIGNLVSDALDFIKDKAEDSLITEKFPILKKGDAIRFCIHRRENITSYQRFMSIYQAMKALIKEGRTVVLISLGATEKALNEYSLKNEIEVLSRSYKNFIYSPVLPYYSDTIALMNKCMLVVTDSGSIQEETNILGIPGIVLRFNSDRPEAIFNGSNVLAPPITKDVVLNIIHSVLNNPSLREKMKKSTKLYGKNVSDKMVKIVEKSTEKDSEFNMFEFMEHQRLGLTKKSFWKKGKIVW